MTQEDFFKRYSFNTKTDHLGEGGFGEVFKAYDTHLDRWVAIKQSKLKKGQENFTLQKEVELATKLPTHPNIAHYEACYRFEIAFAGTFDFGILQYYEEGNLSDLRKAEKINAGNLNQILEGILSGLSHLHKHNIIHRDIKPANILIVKRGRDYIPKITDFGISKQGSDAAASAISNSLAGGTYSYAAPEQLKGESKMRRNADLWSFGVIVYQLMTKKLPFEPTTLDTNSEAARNEVTSLILEGNLPNDIHQIPLPYQKMIQLCLVVDYKQRVQKADELISNLLGNDSSSPIQTHIKLEEKTQITQDDKTTNLTEEIVNVHIAHHKGTTIDDTIVYRATENSDPKIIFDPSTSSKKDETPRITYDKPKKKKWLLVGVFLIITIAFLLYFFPIILIYAKYDYVRTNENKTITVTKKNKYGLLSNTGEIIIPLKYHTIHYFNDGLAWVELNNKYGFIDKTGEIIIPLKYDRVWDFSEGLIAVNLNNKWGYINKSDKVIVPIKYDMTWSFKSGLAPVKLNSKWGYIDQSDNLVIPFQYEQAWGFYNGTSTVKLDGKEFQINKNGDCVEDCP